MIALFLKSQGKASSKQSGIFRHASIMFVLEQIVDVTYSVKMFFGFVLANLDANLNHLFVKRFLEKQCWKHITNK